MQALKENPIEDVDEHDDKRCTALLGLRNAACLLF